MEIMEAKGLIDLCVETSIEKAKIQKYLEIANNKKNIDEEEYLEEEFYGYSLKDLESEFKNNSKEELEQRLHAVTEKLKELNEMLNNAMSKLTNTEINILDMMISESIESKQSTLNSVLERINRAVKDYQKDSETKAKEKYRLILSGCNDSIKSLKIKIHFYNQYLPNKEYNQTKKK